MKYDYLVVGAGLYGAVFAREAKSKGKSVLVIDKRDHIAGNVYTEKIEGEGMDELDKTDFLPNAQILCYPVISSDETISHKWSYMSLLGEEYPNRDKYSPELLVSENTPKAFIWHTAGDQSVPVENSYRYATALSRKGVECELHVFPFGRHGLALSLDDAHVAQWKGLLLSWFRLNAWL